MDITVTKYPGQPTGCPFFAVAAGIIMQAVSHFISILEAVAGIYLHIPNMKLIKVTPNNGRGSLPVYINSDEILRIDFGNSEHNAGCDITLKNGQVLSVFDKPKSIFDAVNYAHHKPKDGQE